MRIAYDARMIYGNYSGVGQYSLNLLRALSRIDSQNQYIVLVRNGFNHNLPDNFRIENLDDYPLSFRTLYGLKRFTNKLNLDLFHSPFNLCPVNLSYPTLVTIHDLMPLSLHNFFQGRSLPVQIYARQFIRYTLKRCLKTSRVILADSHQTKNDIVELRLTEEQKIKVVYPSICIPITSYSGGNSHEQPLKKVDFRILSVGQTRPQKNWWNLIRAFRILRDRMGKCSLALVSSDDRNLKSIKALITELKFEPTEVKILGYQTQEQLVSLYKSVDVFVFPSLYEGFGLPPLEAMACGVPVVASNRGALPEVLGDAALYINPEDVEDIAKGMQKVLEDAALRNTLIQRGYEQVKKYSWERAARQVLGIYNEVHQENRK